jgi:hypothetical protein
MTPACNWQILSLRADMMEAVAMAPISPIDISLNGGRHEAVDDTVVDGCPRRSS